MTCHKGGRQRDGSGGIGRGETATFFSMAGLAEALTRITLGAGVSDLNKSLFYSLVLAGTE